MPVIILMVVIVGGSVIFYDIGHPSAPMLSMGVARSFPESLLVFQNIQGSPATNSTITVLHTNGEVERQFSSSYTDGAFDQYAGSMAPFSSGLLMSNQLSDGTNVSVTKWAVMQPDGQTLSVSPALTGTLNNIWNGSGIIDGNLYLVGQNKLYGVFENTAGYNMQEINLTTGMVRTVLQIQSLNSSTINNNDVQPKVINADQTQISFIMNDVSVNGRDVSGPSVVVYDLVTGSFSVTSLPARLDNVAPLQESQAPMQYALSADGRLLAYQVSGQMLINGVQTTGFMTHVYNTRTGKDMVTNSGSSINLGVCPTSLSFSDDDRYLVACGDTSISENAIIEVTDTATGAVARVLNAGSTANYNLSSIGWSGADDLVYVTNTTTDGQPFNAAAETAHSLNLASGVQQDYPIGFGELLMVIH